MRSKILGKIGILFIGAYRVWLRNALVFRKNIRVNLLPPFIEPLLYLGAIGFGIGAYITDIDGLPYVRFIAPAILAASVMNASFFECAYGTYVRMYYQKTFDALLATPITIQEVIPGEILWGATRGLISALSISIILLILGLASPVGLLLALPLFIRCGFVIFRHCRMFLCSLTLDRYHIIPGYSFYCSHVSLLRNVFSSAPTSPDCSDSGPHIPATHPCGQPHQGASHRKY